MNTFADLFSSPWVQALGWTLMHSLWQSILVTVVVIIAIKCIPTRLPNTRYLVATIGLALIFLLSAGTFLDLITTKNTHIEETVISYQFSLSTVGNGLQKPFTGMLEKLTDTLERSIPAIVLVWGIGALFFSLRVFSGWLYIQRIRSEAVLVGDPWSKLVQHLASSIKIDQDIPLAESFRIQVPIVIGYIKPMILFPVGICSGLSGEQLESIILHELIHIKRKDYLVNIVQSFMEAVYFFNPSVWIISGIMKREREHCCDDAVVQSNRNPLAYVRALAMLEEARLSKPGLALSFADNKNQLLNRIKRLMEKSVRNYSGRERILPFALLIIGLICASWLTIQSGPATKDSAVRPFKTTALSDTTGKSNRLLKDRNNAPGSDVNAKREITSVVDVDNELVVDLNLVQLPIPPITDVDIAIPTIPELVDMDIDVASIQVSPGLYVSIPPQFGMDTIVLPKSWNARNWDKFIKEFETEFVAKFGCKLPQKDIQGMMDELERKFDPQFENDWTPKMEDLAMKYEQLALTQTLKHEQNEMLMAQHEIYAKSAEDRMQQWEKEHALRAKEMEQNLKVMEVQLKAHEKTQKALFKELTLELTKDGYLKEGEKVSRFQINEKTMAFNDKEIKSSDLKKYRAIFDKYSTGTTEKELRKEFSKSIEGRKE